MDKDLEYNYNDNEFFPMEPLKKKIKKSKKNSNNIIKMLALSTVLVTSVVTVSTVINNEILPEIFEPKIVDYVAENDQSPGSYELEFQVDLKDYNLDSIEITGEQTNLNYISDNIELEKVNLTFSKNDIAISEYNYAVFNHIFENLYYSYDINVIVNYYKNDNIEKLLTVTSPKFQIGYSNLIVNETKNNNKIETIVQDNEILCKVLVYDIYIGSFDLKIDEIYLSVDNEQIDVSELFVYPIDIVKGEVLEITFSVPKTEGESIDLNVEIIGDMYFNGEKMNMTSHTVAMKEIILGTSYKVNKIILNEEDDLSINGMKVDKILFNTYGWEYTEELEEVLPGKEVYCRVVLTGKAEKDFTATIEISLNENKIVEFDLSYLEGYIFESDEEAFLEFSFIMPEEDVMEDDIIIYSISEVN